MFMTTTPEPDAAADRAAYDFLLRTVGDVMAAGRFRPGLTDVELAAQTVWAAVHGVASLQIAKGGDPCIRWAPLEARTAAAIDGVLDGLLAAPAVGCGKEPRTEGTPGVSGAAPTPLTPGVPSVRGSSKRRRSS